VIDSKQIRAARGLLDWSRPDLVKVTGLSLEAVKNAEDPETNPRQTTLEAIQAALEKEGVEFTNQSGVRLRADGVEVLVGKKGLCNFFDGVYEFVKVHGGTIMQLGIDENLFWAMGEEYSTFHRSRMADLVKQRRDIQVQAIICEGDTNFIASDYNQYRWMPKELFAAVPFYIYGDCLGIMNFQTIPAPTIILHNFKSITDAYRKQFEVMWNLSREPDTDIGGKPALHLRKE
jgi:transcriptional regulator with XRE-family HTH domain